MSNNSSLQTKDSAMTGDAQELHLKLPVGFTIFALCLQAAIGLLGTIGNVIVCATIIKRPQVLTVMNQYLLSLAFADLGVLLFILPAGVLRFQFPFEWVLGKVVCLYIWPVSEMFFGASIWSITTIAVERYANIAWKKMRIGRRRSLKRSRLIIIAIWAISFATASLPAYIYMKYDSQARSCYTTYSIALRRSIVTMNVILQYILPLSVISFCYQRIAKRVSERLRLFQEETENPAQVREPSSMVNSKAILQQIKRTQRILKPLVILFALTMLPSNIFNLAATYWDKLFYQNYQNLLLLAMFLSTFTNSAADPLVYCIVSKEFRTEAKSLLPRCFRRRFGGQRQRDSTLGGAKRSTGTADTLLSDTKL